ncbi:MAG: flagellar protein FlaG [Pseudomonadales bacterium]
MLNIVNNGLTPAKVREADFTPAEKSESEVIKATALPERQQSAKPEPQELQTAVSKLNNYVQNFQRTLSFSVEEHTGVTVVQVYDSETEELIRQIPPAETIKLAASIEAYSANLLLTEQA